MPLYCPVSILSFFRLGSRCSRSFSRTFCSPVSASLPENKGVFNRKKTSPITPSLPLYSSELLILRCLFSLLSAHLYLRLSFLPSLPSLLLPSVRLLNTHPLLSPLLTLHIPLSLFSLFFHFFHSLYITLSSKKTGGEFSLPA